MIFTPVLYHVSFTGEEEGGEEEDEPEVQGGKESLSLITYRLVKYLILTPLLHHVSFTVEGREGGEKEVPHGKESLSLITYITSNT